MSYSNNPTSIVAGTGISISVPILTSFQNVKVRYCAGNGISLSGGGTYGGTSVGLYECYVVTTTQAAFNLDTMVYTTLVSCAAVFQRVSVRRVI